MAKEKSSGCLIVAIILAVLLALLLVPVGLWYMSASNKSVAARDEAIARAEAIEHAYGLRGSDEGVVVMEKGEVPDLTVPKAGEEITREHIVLFLTSYNATNLTKEAFRKVASEASVKWLLRTDNVFEKNGVLRARFWIPWEIRSNNSSSSSSIQVEAYFAEESRADLLTLSRDEWVTVEGDLSFDADTPTIKNARIVDE